jgi:hypothetical protein
MKLANPFTAFMFRHRFGLLLTSLFCLFVLAAFGQHSTYIDELFLANMCFIVVASLYSVEKITTHFPSFIISGLIVIGGNFIGYFIPDQEADLLAAGLSLAFLMWVIFMLFFHIFSKHIINLNTIVGAVCLFIIIGIAFGFIYLLIDYFVPNSFHLGIPNNYRGSDAFLDRFFYYSFTTMTTLGYGDITPLSHPARYFSACEALVGQLYLTILLARLVGLHLSQSQPTA